MLTKTFRLYRDSYANHPKEVWVLAVLTLINRIGTMVLPFLTIYLTTILNFSLKEAGFLVGTFGFGSLFGAYFGGRFSDRFGPNLVIITSLMVSGLMLIILQFANNFYSLLILIFITASFGESYRPAISTSIGNYVHPSKTGRTMALLRLAINLGMGASPAIAGFIVTSFSYSWLFWIDGVTCISAAIYFIFASRNWKKINVSKSDAVAVEKATLPPHKNETYLWFLLVTFIMAFGFIQWFHTVPVFIKTQWGFDERYIGLLMAFNGLLITTVEMPLIHSIELAKKGKTAVLLGLGLIGMSFLPFFLPNMLVFAFLAMLFLTVGEILNFPFNNSIALNMSPPNRRGEYMSWYAMSWSFGHILAPIAGFAVIDYFGFSVLWGMLSMVIGLGLLVGIKISKKIKY